MAHWPSNSWGQPFSSIPASPGKPDGADEKVGMDEAFAPGWVLPSLRDYRIAQLQNMRARRAEITEDLMSTNFFDRQTAARSSTGWLIVMFCLATAVVVLSLMAVVGCVVASMQQGGGQSRHATSFPWEISLLAGAAAMVMILGGSLFKIIELRAGGGAVVAEQQGGVRIYPDTKNPAHRRLLNIVEEIAIASGTAVPPVYFLENEPGINAFAAGYATSDAVVAVTRGAVEELTREELQGVIAHEFSHILNGDMRIGIRLIGVLQGILLLGLVGQLIFRTMAYSGRVSSRRDSNSGNAMLAIMIIGVALIALGFIGTVLGNLIKAAVSRQRERLADASGVQFTRNPLGLAGALKRIGALEYGSRLQSPNASEASHLYFAEGVWSGFARLWATHPPLPERIRELDPHWDGTFPAAHQAAAEIASELTAGFVESRDGGRAARQTNVPVQIVAEAVDQIGNPTSAHCAYAAMLVGEIPDQIVTAVRTPYSARAVVLSLLIHADQPVRDRQLRELSQIVPPDLFHLVQQLIPLLDAVDVRARLPLADMALPGLAAMSPAQYAEFRTAFESLARSDGQVDLFEWVLGQVVQRHLRPKFASAEVRPQRYLPLDRLADRCAVVFSAVAYAGNDDTEAALAFAAAANCLPEFRIARQSRAASGLGQLQRSLADLQRVAPEARGRVIQACAAAISADGRATLQEAELLRGVADLLDCPMPPLLPGEVLRNHAPKKVSGTVS